MHGQRSILIAGIQMACLRPCPHGRGKWRSSPDAEAHPVRWDRGRPGKHRSTSWVNISENLKRSGKGPAGVPFGTPAPGTRKPNCQDSFLETTLSLKRKGLVQEFAEGMRFIRWSVHISFRRSRRRIPSSSIAKPQHTAVVGAGRDGVLRRYLSTSLPGTGARRRRPSWTTENG